jgi:hypothetical protein
VTRAKVLTADRLADIERAIWADQDWHARQDAEAQLSAVHYDRRARPVHALMRDREVKDIAGARAEMMGEMLATWPAMPRAAFVAKLGLLLGALQARPLADEWADLASVTKRAACPLWWGRQLKRAVVQMREAGGRESGEVCARRRQVYLTDDTVRRMLERDSASRAMLEAAEIESESGEVISLATAVDASVANPVIRRGELMTRIKGCEEWADANGWTGIFTTNTTPSRFHATDVAGKTNPRWIEAGKPTPKDGQAWLCETWARCRAAMQRRGLDVFGFRVAEPHQDGTPHWHMLLWCRPGQFEAVRDVMRDYWLKDSGDEPGAQAYRFKAKAMTAGGAAGYVAKYISKGIDDAGAVSAEGHHDDVNGRALVVDQSDMFGGGAARVRMWARAHGIRQFQPIGQPPVTVWRELRRVEQGEMIKAPEVITSMWWAVNRDGEKRASWATYLERQGGACIGRGYRVAVATEERETVGRYETEAKPVPVGVLDRFNPGGDIVRSARKQWKPAGTWTREAAPVLVTVGVWDITRARARRARPQAAQPRTRVNNCTGPGLESQAPGSIPSGRGPTEGPETWQHARYWGTSTAPHAAR